MKSTQDLYIDVLKEEISLDQFLFQVRKDPRFKQFITPLQSYNDTVQTLKSKGVINEDIAIDYDEDDNNEEENPEQKYGGNTSWKALDRLDKGEGDDLDDSIVKTYSGVGATSSSQHRNAFSLNEEGSEDYSKAFNSVVEKMQQGSGEDDTEVSHMIDIAIAEFDLSDDERKNLEVDVFDWKNQESGTEYNDEDEQSLEDYEGTGLDEVQFLNESANPTHVLDVKKEHPEFDNIRWNQLFRGARYEFEQTEKKDWEKSYVKAGKNLLKDPLYYVNKLNGLKKERKRNDLMIFVKGNNLVDKKNGMVNAPKKESKQGRLKVGSKTKFMSKQKIETMTQKPKKVRGVEVMKVPGKEKKVKLNEVQLKGIAQLIKEEVENYLKKKINENTPSPIEAMKNIATGLVQQGYKKDQIVDCLISLRQGDETKYKELKSKLPQNEVDVDSLYQTSMNENSPAYKGKKNYDDGCDCYTNEQLNEDHLNDKESQIQYILQHKDIIRQQDQITPEYLENLTNNYINKLYLAVEKKVKENEDLGDQEPEYNQLQELILVGNDFNHEKIQNLLSQAYARYNDKIFEPISDLGFSMGGLFKHAKQRFDIIYKQIEQLPLNSRKLREIYFLLKGIVYKGLEHVEKKHQLQEDQDILTEEEIQLQEVKGLEIKAGKKFDMQGDLGKFKKGEKVTVTNVQTHGQDVNFTIQNDQGVEDTFVMDINDKFDDQINENK